MKSGQLPLILAIVATVISAVALFMSLNTGGGKLAYVELPKIFEGYQGMIDAKAAYQQKEDQWNADLDSLGKAFSADVQAYEANFARMSGSKRAKEEKRLNDMRQEFISLRDSVNVWATREDSQLSAKIFEEVNNYITDYGKKNGYNFIFGASGQGNLMHANEAINLTKEITDGLNQDYRP